MRKESEMAKLLVCLEVTRRHGPPRAEDDPLVLNIKAIQCCLEWALELGNKPFDDFFADVMKEGERLAELDLKRYRDQQSN